MSRTARIPLTVSAFAFAAVLFAAPALAGDKVTLGVFLPTTMADGQARFELSEKLGKALEKSLGQPVSVKNFGRYEDFAAASKKQLDVVVVDAWAAAHLGPDDSPVAVATVDGETGQKWAVVTRSKGAVVDLQKSRLAVPRGVKSLDAKFVSHVIFGGDLKAEKHFNLIPVPNAESALRMLDSKSAEAALVPAKHAPADARIAYRSERLPGVVAIVLKGDRAAYASAFAGMEAVGPISGFAAPKNEELNGLRALLTRGPPRRQPVIAESPVVRPGTSVMVNVKEVGLVLPSFLDQVEDPQESPDD